jgi:hypothetical protein
MVDIFDVGEGLAVADLSRYYELNFLKTSCKDYSSSIITCTFTAGRVGSPT